MDQFMPPNKSRLLYLCLGKTTPIKFAISNQMCICKASTKRISLIIPIQRVSEQVKYECVNIEIDKDPQSQSLHDETKNNKQIQNACFKTEYYIQLIIIKDCHSEKKVQKFSKSTPQRNGVI